MASATPPPVDWGVAVAAAAVGVAAAVAVVGAGVSAAGAYGLQQLKFLLKSVFPSRTHWDSC